MAVSRRGFLKISAGGAAGLALSGLGAGSVLSFLNGCTTTTGNLRSIVDMGGREVKVPVDINKVFCTNPIGTVDLYTLAPDMLVGWNFRPTGDNKKYIPDEYFDLPTLGVWMGAGAVPNSEEIAKINSDILFCYWTANEVGISMANEIRNQTGFSVVLIDYDIRSTAESYRYVAELIGRDERGELLASYCEDKLDFIREIVSKIPQQERKSIFLAQGTDGLMTDPVGSMHITDALELLGVTNVAEMPGTEGKGMGMPTVNVEQVITWNPDAILVAEYSMSNAESSDIYGEIVNSYIWKNVPCVAAGEVYRIPQSPFSWFGRPPSVARMLGCLWLLNNLYPSYVGDLDMRAETRAFYELFYNIKLDDATLSAILNA